MALPVGFETQVKECSLLVATDGLWKYLDRTRIAKAAALRPLETASETLVAGVRMKSGALQDDVAIAIIESK
jgi:serine/threonine protein phosphatase PrpC